MTQTPPTWPQHREPLRATLTRNFTIAVVAGGVAALSVRKPLLWPIVAALALWPTFGGHWLEMLFLNGIRSRLPGGRLVQIVGRLAVWFAGGVVLGFAVFNTMRILSVTSPVRMPPWWVAGVAFILVELVAHFALSMRKQPSFFGGDG